MRKVLLLITVIIGFISCNNKTENKQQMEKSPTAKTEKIKKILFVLTSHENLGNTGEKPVFGLKNLQHLITY
jgi:hypothetical protein